MYPIAQISVHTSASVACIAKKSPADVHSLDTTVNFSSHTLFVKTEQFYNFLLNNISLRTYIHWIESFYRRVFYWDETPVPNENEENQLRKSCLWMGLHSLPIFGQKNKTYFDFDL